MVPATCLVLATGEAWAPDTEGLIRASGRSLVPAIDGARSGVPRRQADYVAGLRAAAGT